MCSKRGMELTGIMTFLVACCGCGAAPPAADRESAASPAIAVRLVDHDEIEAERAKHLGRVVVLDCWSTSCPPCVREFPGLVALQRRFGERVACLSLSFDYEGIGSPEEVVPRVEDFLRGVGAGGIVNLVSREDADVLSKKMEIASVPVVFVWRPDGTLARRFDDDMAARELGRAFTYDDVTAVVEESLGR